MVVLSGLIFLVSPSWYRSVCVQGLLGPGCRAEKHGLGCLLAVSSLPVSVVSQGWESELSLGGDLSHPHKMLYLLQRTRS